MRSRITLREQESQESVCQSGGVDSLTNTVIFSVRCISVRWEEKCFCVTVEETTNYCNSSPDLWYLFLQYFSICMKNVPFFARVIIITCPVMFAKENLCQSWWAVWSYSCRLSDAARAAISPSFQCWRWKVTGRLAVFCWQFLEFFNFISHSMPHHMHTAVFFSGICRELCLFLFWSEIVSSVILRELP